MPNDQPLDGYVPQYPVSSSLGSLHIPQSDHQYSYSHQQEPKSCILSDGTLYHSSKTSTSCLASPRKNHSRRREPGHIPRPRNAFIIFRSSYIITRCTAEGEEQQNELSKQAGKAWNRMSEEEKKPFTHLAKLEKMQHQAMYPNYIYCPGRRRQNTVSTKRTSELSAPSVSSKSTTPENPSAAPTLRLPHPATQLAIQRYFSTQSIPPSPPSMSPPREDSPIQEIFDFASPEFNPLHKMEVVRPIISTQASESDASSEEDDFVPTADIPELELTPSKNKVICCSQHLPAFILTFRQSRNLNMYLTSPCDLHTWIISLNSLGSNMTTISWSCLLIFIRCLISMIWHPPEMRPHPTLDPLLLLAHRMMFLN